MIAIKIKKSTLIVKISGELDLVVAKEFSESVDKVLLDKPIKNLILDLSMVSFIDSSGLGAILGRYKIIEQQGGSMSIFGAIPSVFRILEISGIMKIIPVLTSEEYVLERKEA